MAGRVYRGRISVSPDLLIQELPDGETVFLHLKTEEYFGLDEVGTRMWSLLAGGSSVEEAYDRLLEEYDVEPEQLRQDLDDLVQQLAKHGMIELDDD